MENSNANSSDIKSHNEPLEYLHELGCCHRCALRFTGVRGSKEYQRSTKPEAEENPNKLAKVNPCVTCIGLVQDCVYRGALGDIIDRVLKADYDARVFSCSLSLPVSLKLREHAVWNHLVTKFPEIYEKKIESDHVTSLKDVWKFINHEEIEKAIEKKFEFNNSPLQIRIDVLYADDELECSSLLKMNPEKFKQKSKGHRKEVFTRNGVEVLLANITTDVFRSNYDLNVPRVPFHYGEVTCSHVSLHVGGRYNKFSRTLSQTPWIVDGVKKMETSIQELIVKHLEPFFKVQSSKFSSSGREDVDVRTLGDGRPFAVELLDPHRTLCSSEDLIALQKTINRSTRDIAVHHLQVVSKELLAGLKEGEEHKTKSYSALCVVLDGTPLSPEEICSLEQKELVVMQKTPIRVLHRRPLAIRPRTIHEVKAESVADKPDHFILRVKTQAGTYVKEFVHGDFNRTTPNVCSMLGRQVDIVALDVDRVELDWPPPLPVTIEKVID